MDNCGNSYLSKTSILIGLPQPFPWVYRHANMFGRGRVHLLACIGGSRQAAASISQTVRQGTCLCIFNDFTTSDTCTLHTQLADGYTWLVWNSFTTEKLIYSCKGFSGFSNSPQSAHIQYHHVEVYKVSSCCNFFIWYNGNDCNQLFNRDLQILVKEYL